MKKITKALGITLLAGSLLVACSNDEDTDTPENNDDNGTSDEQVENDDNGADEGTNDEDEVDSDENTESDDESDTGGELGADQEFGDQLDLGIGDTAQISSNQGAYEITIHSVKREETVEDNSSMFDYFIIVDLTVKNIGDEKIDAYDPVGILDQTARLDGSGANDFSQNYETIEAVSGDLQPGDELSGQALFHVKGNDEQFIRVLPGLIASGGVYNDAVWTFTEDEME